MKKRKRKFPISFYVGVSLLIIIIFLIITAPLISPYDAYEMDSGMRLQGISRAHLFGTDRFGRDIFSRVLIGGRITLFSCGVALCSALILGIIIGLIAGLEEGSFWDKLIMRIVDLLMAFPFTIIAIVVAAYWGTGLNTLLAVVISVWWVPFTRMTRSLVLKAKTEIYVSAAQVLGAPKRVIVFRELLPRILGTVLVQATFQLSALILAIAALSFVGLGTQPPAPEWGSMLADGRDHFFQAPYILLGPSLFIILTALSLNLIGEGMRDRLDPYENLQF